MQALFNRRELKQYLSMSEPNAIAFAEWCGATIYPFPNNNKGNRIHTRFHKTTIDNGLEFILDMPNATKDFENIAEAKEHKATANA